MTASSWLEIDLSVLDANVRCWRALVRPGVKLCAVVKADAYGLGAAVIGPRLEAAGVDMLAVYSQDQAAALIEAGVRGPVLVLMPLVSGGYVAAPVAQLAAAGRLHVTAASGGELALAETLGRSVGGRTRVHLYVDTGMSRAGLRCEELPGAAAKAVGSDALSLEGIYTHMASSECDWAFTGAQARRFDDAVSQASPALPKGVTLHLANSMAAMRDAGMHYGMVRLGLALWGYGPTLPSDGPKLAGCEGLRPIMRWLATVAHVQGYAKGTPVGYGSTHRLTRDSVLALLPVGYADGYPLLLSGKGVVEVVRHGEAPRPAPVLGRINMDQIVVDVTDIPGPRIEVGDTAVLYSHAPDSPCALPRLAALAKSHCYELLCRLSPWLPRVWIK